MIINAGIELQAGRIKRHWIQTIKRSETAQSHQHTEDDSSTMRCDTFAEALLKNIAVNQAFIKDSHEHA